MEIEIHADDYGLSEGITDSILETIANGAVNGVSIVANGNDFGRAVRLLADYPQVHLSVHLNLLELAPLASVSEVKPLLDSDGRLNASFGWLWSHWLFASRGTRRRFESAVRSELDAQIQRVRESFPDRPLRLDGHMHSHLIPFVFDIVMDLAQKHCACHVRIPREPWFLSIRGGGWRHYVGANLVKHILLNFLYRVNMPRLAKAGVGYNEAFIGVLFTGEMTACSIRTGLLAARKRAWRRVEVLCHPGRARENEYELWKSRPKMWAFYTSPNRKTEANLLTGTTLTEILNDFEQRDASFPSY